VWVPVRFHPKKLGKLARSTSAPDSGFTHDLGFAVEISELEAIPFFWACAMVDREAAPEAQKKGGVARGI
jgi:uncharacterized protein YcsI (UPF0317 family)